MLDMVQGEPFRVMIIGGGKSGLPLLLLNLQAHIAQVLGGC